MADRIVRLIYVSAARQAFTSEHLAQVLETSRANNAEIGVTGMLVYHDNHFVQVLEGPESAVESTFQRISLDDRHQSVSVHSREDVDRRAFGEWSMGYASPDDPGTAPEALQTVFGMVCAGTPDPSMRVTMTGFLRDFGARMQAGAA